MRFHLFGSIQFAELYFGGGVVKFICSHALHNRHRNESRQSVNWTRIATPKRLRSNCVDGQSLLSAITAGALAQVADGKREQQFANDRRRAPQVWRLDGPIGIVFSLQELIATKV